MILFTAPPPLQAAGKDYQNADVLATVRQHDRGVGFWQPGVREWSKYGRHDERERRGLTEHQRAVLIHPASHLAVILSRHLTVHQQREPYGFIFHRLSVRHCGCSWKRYRGEKDILSCHRDFRHCPLSILTSSPFLSLKIISLMFCNRCHRILCSCLCVKGFQSSSSSYYFKRKLKQLDWFWSSRY